MKRHLQSVGIALAFVAATAFQSAAADLREAVPSDVYLATYHQANPERDYQKAYFEDIWKTVEQTKIVEKFLDAVQTSMSDDDVAKLDEVRTTLTDALKPVKWDALANCSESVYAQKFAIPAVQHLVLIRVGQEGSDSLVEGLTNLFELAETASNGAVSVVKETADGVELTSLQLPSQAPYRPTIGTVGDVFVFSSTTEFARESLALMDRPEAESKFDDPRVKTALAKLPKAEDGVTFFDGKALFRQLGDLPDFVRTLSRGNPDVERAVGLMESVFGQINVFDFEVTVEYTEGHQNRTASFGRVSAEAGEKVAGKMFSGQKPFDQWSRWVPENATGFSISSGANLHPAYAWLMEIIPQQFPETQEGLDQFERIQEQLDLHLDADLLQSFSGESVSVALPGGGASALGGSGQSVTFLRCTKPARIKELVHRLFDQLQQNPQLQSQRLSLKPVAGMDGFEEISATFLGIVGVKPVIGFHDDWMVIGTHADAVKAVLKTQAGEAASIAETDRFLQFETKIDGPVTAISYADLAANTRAMSQGLQQVGAMLPFLLAMSGQNPADLKPAEKFLALLPSAGKIIGKFDFYQSQLSVTEPGPDGLTYTRRSVTLIRPPRAAGDAGTTAP